MVLHFSMSCSSETPAHTILERTQVLLLTHTPGIERQTVIIIHHGFLALKKWWFSLSGNVCYSSLKFSIRGLLMRYKKSNTKKNAPSCNGECVKNLRYIFAHDFIHHTYDHARVVIHLICLLIQYCKHLLNDLYIKFLGSILRFTFSESMLLNQLYPNISIKT